jgi:hypothetical protein
LSICLIDAWRPGDPALANSHWIAEQTAHALGHALPHEPLTILENALVDRSTVEAALTVRHDGYAYFGHGRDHLLYRDKDESRRDPDGNPLPIPLIDRTNVRLIGARWFHAFACLTGMTLCHDAADASVAAYLGYHDAVIVEWDIPELPDELRALLAELVTTATLQLASGERSQSTIYRHVRDASNRLIDWYDQHQDDLSISERAIVGLHAFANQLYKRLVLKGTATTP